MNKLDNAKFVSVGLTVNDIMFKTCKEKSTIHNDYRHGTCKFFECVSLMIWIWDITKIIPQKKTQLK